MVVERCLFSTDGRYVSYTGSYKLLLLSIFFNQDNKKTWTSLDNLEVFHDLYNPNKAYDMNVGVSGFIGL